MAISSTRAVTMLVDIIKASPLAVGEFAVNGVVKASKRPINSTREDIVVNAPVVNREAIQKGLLNANIYVPNLRELVNGSYDTSIPNMARLNQLGDIAEAVLSNYVTEDGIASFELLEDRLTEDTNNQHYLNLRVIFTALNV